MNYNPFSLEGKTILVTGASSGIGRATAIECSKMGATVILTARNVERLNETLSMMEGEGHCIIPADLADEEQIKALVNQLPQLEGVVNNAGITKGIPIKFYKKAKIDEVFNINSFASIFLVKHLLKGKKMRKGASVVFTSSITNQVVVNGNGIYGMSKAVIESFMRQSALELSSLAIRSNAVAPGMIETNLLKEDFEDGMADAFFDNDKQKYLAKRYGRPEEVAWAIVYLLSDASAFVTGTSLVIDGGRCLVH